MCSPSLTKRLVVRLDAVDDDAPLSLDVDGAQRRDVRGQRRAEVRLVAAVLQDVHGVVRIGDHILYAAWEGRDRRVSSYLHYLSDWRSKGY